MSQPTIAEAHNACRTLPDRLAASGAITAEERTDLTILLGFINRELSRKARSTARRNEARAAARTVVQP